MTLPLRRRVELDRSQVCRPRPDVAAAAYHRAAVGLHGRHAGVPAAETLVETPRRRVDLESEEIDAQVRVRGIEPGSGPPHERGADPAALRVADDVKIVDERAPNGIVSAVRADEADQIRGVESQLHELILGRTSEPRAPGAYPLAGE